MLDIPWLQENLYHMLQIHTAICIAIFSLLELESISWNIRFVIFSR